MLSANFYPPIKLDTNTGYALGLHCFYSYKSIANIYEGNNVINCKSPTDVSNKIPPGVYEINEIIKPYKPS